MYKGVHVHMGVFWIPEKYWSQQMNEHSLTLTNIYFR